MLLRLVLNAAFMLSLFSSKLSSNDIFLYNGMKAYKSIYAHTNLFQVLLSIKNYLKWVLFDYIVAIRESINARFAKNCCDNFSQNLTVPGFDRYFAVGFF